MRKIFQLLTPWRQDRVVEAPGRRRIDLGSKAPTFPIYVIGDVHGCIDLLKAAEARIHADIVAQSRQGLVILLGDYVDRGPCSAEVIEHLVAPSALHLKRLCLCGNHEEAFLRFLAAPKIYRRWLDFAGPQTLLSYGVDILHIMDGGGGGLEALERILAEAVPSSHLRFLESMPLCIRIGEYLFVHAGVRPGVLLSEQTDNDLLWIREPFLTKGPGTDMIVIHGHTPVLEPVFGLGRIGIDTGAYHSGRLTVLKILDGKAAPMDE